MHSRRHGRQRTAPRPRPQLACPRLAAAMGWRSKERKSTPTGAPSSRSMMASALSALKAGTRSCATQPAREGVRCGRRREARPGPAQHDHGAARHAGLASGGGLRCPRAAPTPPPTPPPHHTITTTTNNNNNKPQPTPPPHTLTCSLLSSSVNSAGNRSLRVENSCRSAGRGGWGGAAVWVGGWVWVWCPVGGELCAVGGRRQGCSARRTRPGGKRGHPGWRGGPRRVMLASCGLPPRGQAGAAAQHPPAPA